MIYIDATFNRNNSNIVNMRLLMMLEDCGCVSVSVFSFSSL